jgi:pimeloyl-ACP methyl ester carboxylesterase
MINTKNVVFITGAFVTNHCWDKWKDYFERHGYNTIAPPWPHKDASVEELRNRRPNDTDLATMEIKEVIDYYADIVKSFPEKPIVIGHSFGGLITQIIVNRDLAAAGIVIHSAPPQGLIPYEFSFLKAGWKAFGLFTDLEKTYLMSFEDFQYAFVNGMPLEEQKKAYNELVIPESKTVTRGALTDAAKIDYDKPHVPLLFTAGSEDHLIPAHLNHRNYERYHKDHSVVDYKEFDGRNHNVLGQKTWKEDADYILDWIETH